MYKYTNFGRSPLFTKKIISFLKNFSNFGKETIALLADDLKPLRNLTPCLDCSQEKRGYIPSNSIFFLLKYSDK